MGGCRRPAGAGRAGHDPSGASSATSSWPCPSPSALRSSPVSPRLRRITAAAHRRSAGPSPILESPSTHSCWGSAPVLAGLVLATAVVGLPPPRQAPAGETDVRGQFSFLSARLAVRMRVCRPALSSGSGWRSNLGAGDARSPCAPRSPAPRSGWQASSGVLTFGASLDRLVDSPVRYGANYDVAPDLNDPAKDGRRAVALPDVVTRAWFVSPGWRSSIARRRATR